MIKKRTTKFRKINPEVHEHLEFVMKNTTCADRLRWLEEANAFVRSLQKKKNYPDLGKKH